MSFAADMVSIIVVKFEEINFKIQKVRRSSGCNNVQKSSKTFEIHIQSKLLAEVTHCCNNVLLG